MADIDFSWMDDLLSDDTDYGYMFDDSGDGAVNLDFDYDPSNSGITSLDFDVSSLFGDDDYSYLFGSDDDGIANLDFDYKPGVDFSDVYDNLFNENTNYDDTVKELYPDLFMDSTKDLIANADTSSSLLERALNFLSGNKDKKKGEGKGILQGQGQLFGGSGLETLIKLAMINKLRKQDRDDPNEVVPIGSDAFAAVGQGQGLGTMPDYRTFNIQPALMPGVGYANAPPPGMKQGGVSDGPGDITLARLEPGEFVMTRKATDNIGAKNLYKLMKDAERMN